MRRRIFSLAAALMLLCCACIPAFAHEVPDLTRKGSVEIQISYDSKAVAGGTLTLYLVGEAAESDGNYSFKPTGKFSNCGKSLDNIQSGQLAKDLADYAKKNNISGTTKTIDSKGNAVFSELSVGLYLLVQNKAADGYNAISPFLVSVPKHSGGAYVYDVDASPKVELTPETTKPTSPTSPTTSTKPTTPDDDDDDDDKKLPQTGQLNWPVPVLTVMGLVLFTFGWALRFRQEKNEYEK